MLIPILIGVAIISGALFANAIMDWLFICAYAFCAVSIVSRLLHLSECRKAHVEIDTEDITASVLYLLLGIGLAVVQILL